MKWTPLPYILLATAALVLLGMHGLEWLVDYASGLIPNWFDSAWIGDPWRQACWTIPLGAMQ